MSEEGIRLVGDGGNVFAEEMDARHGRDPRSRKIGIMAVVTLLLWLVAVIVPRPSLLFYALFHTTNGRSGSLDGEYGLSTFVAELSESMGHFAAFITGNFGWSGSTGSTMTLYAMVVLAGGALALSGAVYQGTFRNALVSPSTLGVMAGGQFGFMVWVLIFVNGGLLSQVGLKTDAYGNGVEPQGAATFFADGVPYEIMHFFDNYLGLSILSFLGCLTVVGLVLLCMKVCRISSKGFYVIIVGQVIAGVFGSVLSLVRYYYSCVDPYGDICLYLTELNMSVFWKPYTVIDLAVIFAGLLITFFVVSRLSHRMMLLSFSEGESRTIGVDVAPMRTVVIALCTVLTGIVVAFVGAVGFVGLLVPHLARRLVGPDFKYLLPASVVLGGLFLLAAMLLIEVTLGGSYRTLVGIFISIGGAAVFLATALRGRGSLNGSFK